MICWRKKGVRIDKRMVTWNEREILTLICYEANSILHLSASVTACSFSLSTPAVMKFPM
jgi:hypothetical protein